MKKRIPLARPVLGPEEEEAVAEVLRSGHLVQGPRVAEFERRVAERLDVAEGVAVSSGTAAIHLPLLALGCGPGDEVIVPAFGFPATANAVEVCGARAIPADVDPETFAITAETVSAALSRRTAGVVPVHPFGIPAPMHGLDALADEAGLWMVEDAACALGTVQDDRWGSGRWPLTLSFHPRKVLTTGEGGLIGTDDRDLAARLRRLRSHGMDADAPGWERFVEAGFNYRMTDLAAAIGLVQMGRLDDVVGARRWVGHRYREALAEVEGVHVPRGYELPDLGWQSLVVVLADGLDRDAVMRELDARGIGSTIGGYSLVEQPYYRERYDLDASRAPVACRLAEQSLTLPLTTTLDEGDVRRVTDALADIIGG
ncbi:MAG: DegT/DnrJ/EryC1/StrS family aminotransferase [Myxococcota bacterium]